MMQAVSWLGAASPVWLSLCLILAFGLLAWQVLRLIRRVDMHAQSIAHMDEWADVVDHSLKQIEERSRRSSAPPPAPAAATPSQRPQATSALPTSAAAQRALAELKSRWQK